MTKLEIEWTWKTESPLHCGSGLSRPGQADRLVQRDSRRRAFIPGDAVKGALRMSAEQVLSWLECSQETSYANSTAEPRLAVMQALFGGGHRHHYAAAFSDYDPPCFRLPATAIDRTTGRAKDDTLRTVEVVAPDVEFKTSCSLWLCGSDEQQELARTLFLTALLATESVGGKAGIGWGRVKLSDTASIRIDDRAFEQEDLPNRDRLQALADHVKSVDCEKNWVSVSQAPPPLAGATDGKWFQLTFSLLESTTIGAKPEVANKVLTLDSIPGTVIRGALREAWRAAGHNDGQIAAWLADRWVWTPALPAHGPQGSLEPCVPAPLSYLRVKDETGFDGGHGLRDTLAQPAAENHLQWQPLRSAWLKLLAGGIARNDAADERETRMHVARNYETGSKRAGALFAREALPSSQDERRCFVAYARVPENIPWPTDVRLGKRRSTGHGSAELNWVEVDDPWPRQWSSPQTSADTSQDVFVHLLSPAIVRDKDGHPLRSLGADTWKRLFDVQPSAVEACIAIRSIPGWMMNWGHGRAPVSCLAPGSVWRLTCTSAKEATDLRAAIGRSGLGERRHEGYGAVVVDPPWLGRPIPAVVQSQKDETPGDDARLDWPGAEGVAPIELETICDEIANLPTMKRDTRSCLQELSSRAREAASAEDCAKVLAFSDQMSNRERARRWEQLKEGTALRKLLGRLQDNPIKLRFALEALLIHAKEAPEE
jgi:CRISPR/Cas system CSM-associated protein Csm3 (group 7 of RAMP superfamily)